MNKEERKALEMDCKLLRVQISTLKQRIDYAKVILNKNEAKLNAADTNKDRL